MDKKTAVIIGAGPAGLTAAYELLKRTDIVPIVYEMTEDIGGISKTVKYKGNRIDIGGHRFFSKSDRVMDWWNNIMPVSDEGLAGQDVEVSYQNKKRTVAIDANSEETTLTMMVRNRLSRILYGRKLYDYPLSLNIATLSNLGFIRLCRIGFGYAKAIVFPIKPEETLEHFLINRFGRELYLTFFKDYTEKVWGVPCTEIGADWGAQRIKGLSITKAVLHALKKPFAKSTSVKQKNVETSLIERFLYPKLGPGQMWEEVARQVIGMGGEVHFNVKAVGFEQESNQLVSAQFENKKGEVSTIKGDYFFSTMPMKNLVNAMGDAVPVNISEIAAGLKYRDFLTVGILVDKLLITSSAGGAVEDNWIYIQESDVKVGRIQVFNNWSPYLVADPDKVWLGLEYFCNEGDDLWIMNDASLCELAGKELEKIGVALKSSIEDSVVIRMPKAYPGYFGEAYKKIDDVVDYLKEKSNLFLIGRNGMHKYNNQDHSMLTAMVSVDNIIAGKQGKDNIWMVNADKEYHESK